MTSHVLASPLMDALARNEVNLKHHKQRLVTM
jgi:hypothetical protein